MLYVSICDEMRKVKDKVEIKGENVRLISNRLDPTVHRTHDLRPDRGRPTETVEGPL